MLGRYENFPEVVHGIARFTCESSARQIQQAILFALHRLNEKVSRLGDIASHLSQGCEVSFELGVAEGFDFNFLDRKELVRLQRGLAEREFPTLDFFCVTRYHVVKDQGRRVPLRFDYHKLRFVFQEPSVELRICHERGPQRVSLEDLVTFIARPINEELCQKRFPQISLEYLRAAY